jgi:hypothetical protein
MAGGNGHLGGIDAGPVLRIRKPRVFFRRRTTGLEKPIRIDTAKKKGNGSSEKAKRKPQNTFHECPPLEQRIEYEGISAKLIH